MKEPDEFLSAYTRAELFVRRHNRAVLVGIVVVLAAALAVTGVRRYREARAARAASAYSAVLATLNDAGGNDEGKKENAGEVWEAAAQKLRTLSAMYSSLPMATLARFSLASLEVERGNYEQGAEIYRALAQDLKPGEHPLWELAQLGEANALHAQKRYDAAVDSYRRILEQAGARAKGEALLGIARCYEQMNNLQAALKSYSELNEAYPDAAAGMDLSLKIESLKVRLKGSQG
ncbi:MAG: tetratricopeptide repeat protein [Candidatus Tectomicrobia bacterium]|nr:tetratricopeptide repeat protein [Candidatus Tectomicrobia bacterium]